MRPLALCLALIAASGIGVAGAAEGTDCSFGGPSPGWRAILMDLPHGSDFLTLELGGTRAQRGTYTQDDWHLASGILVVDAQTLEIESFRLTSKGMAPRRVIVDGVGADTSQDVSAPDVPYEHQVSAFRANLPPGTYYAISFGTDGGKALPNEWWSAGVQVSDPSVRCTNIGDGDVFDFDQSRFSGMQVYAPGAGVADSISMSVTQARGLVVGLMDAETQVRNVSSVSLDYTTPTSSGNVSQKLVPFVSTAGTYAYTASYRGAYPLIDIAGVAIDLPPR